MDDEEWVIEDPSETAAAEAEAAAAAEEEAAAAAAVTEAAAAAEAEAAAAADAEQTLVKGTEPKKLIFKHWVRPKFLQYNYMYDYRHNYYDDVIAYLDRRNRGLLAEPPRAQSWAERALRSYLARGSLAARAARRDADLLRHISSGARFHRYHSKSLISRKYSSLGFNTVSI